MTSAQSVLSGLVREKRFFSPFFIFFIWIGIVPRRRGFVLYSRDELIRQTVSSIPENSRWIPHFIQIILTLRGLWCVLGSQGPGETQACLSFPTKRVQDSRRWERRPLGPWMLFDSSEWIWKWKYVGKFFPLFCSAPIIKSVLLLLWLKNSPGLTRHEEMLSSFTLPKPISACPFCCFDISDRNHNGTNLTSYAADWKAKLWLLSFFF